MNLKRESWRRGSCRCNNFSDLGTHNYRSAGNSKHGEYHVVGIFWRLLMSLWVMFSWNLNAYMHMNAKWVIKLQSFKFWFSVELKAGNSYWDRKRVLVWFSFCCKDDLCPLRQPKLLDGFQCKYNLEGEV